MKDQIHIAFGIHDKTGDYVRHTTTAIISILENTKECVSVHILHDETLIEENKERLRKICSFYNAEIFFYSVKLDIEEKSYPAIRILSKGALYRLKVPQMLIDVKKVIYFDSDVICCLNIKYLWEENISDFIMGTVRDSITYRIGIDDFTKMSFFSKIKIMNEKYFNSGVLYMNLEKFRKEGDLFKKCLAFLVQYPNSPTLDQDALNFFYQDKVVFLNERYNMSVPYNFTHRIENFFDKKSWEGYIWHFTSQKPWECKIYPIDILYWKYFRMTFWGKTDEKFIHYLKKTHLPLEKAVLETKILSRKRFVNNFTKRLYKEIISKLKGE